MSTFSMVFSEITGALVAAGSLLRELGIGKTLTVFAGVARDQAAGMPWKELGPPKDRKEALSRRQIGSAVLLERRLREVAGDANARRITTGVVLKASVDFLSRNVPALRREKMLLLSPDERRTFMENTAAKFFNADATITIHGDQAMDMTVTRCRFVELLEAIGEKDMAPVFCEGDGCFFGERQPEVVLDRPEKLSTGGSCCDFRFKWKNAG